MLLAHWCNAGNYQNGQPPVSPLHLASIVTCTDCDSLLPLCTVAMDSWNAHGAQQNHWLMHAMVSDHRAMTLKLRCQAVQPMHALPMAPNMMLPLKSNASSSCANADTTWAWVLFRCSQAC